VTKNQKHKTGIVVLYHKNCPDGFGAAWAAWKKFGKRAKYIGVNHQEPPPSNFSGKHIYMLDFTYPREHTLHVLKNAKSLTILDHHKSAKDVTLLAPVHRFARNHSGAALSWNFFHYGKKIPRWLLYIEDLDLWRRKLPHTEDARAALNTYPYDFKVWDRLMREFDNTALRAKYFQKGAHIIEFQRRAVKRIIDDAQLVIFYGYRTLAANTPTFTDEVGYEITKLCPPIGVVWSYRGGKLIVSLRSNGKVDVSKLAKKLGGGGHKQAAAFTLPAYKKFPWEPLKK